MNVICTCKKCHFSEVRNNNKTKDPAYNKSKYFPVNHWICNKCGEVNFYGVTSVNKLIENKTV